MIKSDVNLNLYKVFYDVTKYGSFSKTAEFTYTTQSSISKSIKKLEDDLNTKLFYRKPHGIELTEDGKSVLYYVEKAYGNLLTAERMLKETDNLERGKLNIGLPSYISSFYFMDKIIEFYKKYPNIEITLINGNRESLLDMLNKHQLDFFIYSSPITNEIKDDSIEIVNLYKIKYTFFCRIDEYDKYKNIKTIKDIENIPLVLPVPGSNNRKFLDEVLLKNDVMINRAINIHTSEGIITGVKNGLGVGYIISDIIKNDNSFKCIDIDTKLHEEKLILVYNKKILTKVPSKFINDYINIDIN